LIRRIFITIDKEEKQGERDGEDKRRKKEKGRARLGQEKERGEEREGWFEELAPHYVILDPPLHGTHCTYDSQTMYLFVWKPEGLIIKRKKMKRMNKVT
jgi:hypothetical protein